MLQIIVLGEELWDEKKQEFIYKNNQVLQLEHSLVSLSKWESRWCKPFLTKQKKTPEETLDYFKCMTITQNVNPEIYNCLSADNVKQINQYINAPMTATTISENGNEAGTREQITAELIYYWMIALNIPFECQKWHLNKLLTLIRVCNIKNQPPKRRSKKDLLKHHAAVNAARRKR